MFDKEQMMEIFFSHALMIIAKTPERPNLEAHGKDIAATDIDYQEIRKAVS